MYSKLLINVGGGIVSRSQQSEQDNCATVAIGLGGTGISCLRALKRAVYTRVAPDPTDDYIPRYSHIQFLAVDTDRASIGTAHAVDAFDEATEFFHLACQDLIGLLKKARDDPSLQWLKTASTEDTGAGVQIYLEEIYPPFVRQLVRLLLFHKYPIPESHGVRNLSSGTMLRDHGYIWRLSGNSLI